MAFVVVIYEVLDRVFVDGETVDHRMVSIQEEILEGITFNGCIVGPEDFDSSGRLIRS